MAGAAGERPFFLLEASYLPRVSCGTMLCDRSSDHGSRIPSHGGIHERTGEQELHSLPLPSRRSRAVSSCPFTAGTPPRQGMQFLLASSLMYPPVTRDP